MIMEARLYNKEDSAYVRCNLCAHRCRISEGKRGICGVRENRGGTLYTTVYGELVASHVDPIEKKPLFHFKPGSLSYSVASVGCNFRCLHCQNYNISQIPPADGKRIAGREVTSEEVVEDAIRRGCESIAYTYTEPTVFFEFAYDCMKKAKTRGIKNVFVTNGYMTRECLDALDGLLDAANVDIKSFSDVFYRKVCGARLDPVLKSIELMKQRNIWVEVTTLLIPTLNDTEKGFREIARWLYGVDPDIPWHVSAFYPTYKLNNLPETPVSTLRHAREAGMEEGLRYVYTGNLPGDSGESTYCFNCGERLICRYGFTIKQNRIRAGRCPACDSRIKGVEMDKSST